MRKFAIVATACIALFGASGVAQAQTWNGQQDPHHPNQVQMPNGFPGNWGQGFQNPAQFNWPQQLQVPYNQGWGNNQGSYNQGHYGNQGWRNNQGSYNQGHHGNQGWGNNQGLYNQGHHGNQGWGNNGHRNGNGNRNRRDRHHD